MVTHKEAEKYKVRLRGLIGDKISEIDSVEEEIKEKPYLKKEYKDYLTLKKEEFKALKYAVRLIEKLEAEEKCLKNN